MMLSVHMLSYNQEKYIRQALDGVLMQRVAFPMELVVSDDASTDSTPAILQEYAEKYPNIVKPLLREKNVGCIRNYWENFERCSGKYVALIDGDDYWTDPLKLQKQVDFLEAHPDYGLVYTDLESYNEKFGRIEPFPIDRVDGYAYDSQLMELRGIWTVTVCLRKSLLDNMPILDDRCFKGDTFIWLEISRKSLVKYLPEKTAIYRILTESVSHIPDARKRARFLNSVAHLYLYYVNHFPSNISLINQHVRKKWNLRRFSYALRCADYPELLDIHIPFFPLYGCKEVFAYLGSKILRLSPRLLRCASCCVNGGRS